MPEGPEVETVRKYLESSLVGQTIANLHAFWPKSVQPSAHHVLETIRGQQIHALRRQGKYLLIHLATHILCIHLRMSGKLFLQASQAAPDPHLRASISFDNGEQLHLIDTRKFARISLLKHTTELTRVGKDLLNGEVCCTEFVQTLSKAKGAIKAKLLAQSPFCGVGNIYADEALWICKLHPLCPVQLLSSTQLEQLYYALIHVLQQGLANLGTSLGHTKVNFYSSPQRRGQNDSHLQVYKRTGRPCLRCNNLIIRIQACGRSSHICPICQAPLANSD